LGWPGKSWHEGTTHPKFSVQTGGGVRPATARDVELEFGVGRPDTTDEDAMPGYYYLSPGARITLTAALPWKLERAGRFILDACVSRYSPITNNAIGTMWMSCPPVVLEAVPQTQPDETGPGLEAPPWGDGAKRAD